MELTEKVQYLFDRIEIQDVIARYAIGQDAHQGDDFNILQQWDETFTEDGVTDYSATGVPVCSYRELANWMRGNAANRGRMNEEFSNWQHMLGLPTVKIDGNTAEARTDLWATHKGIPKQGERPYHLYDACTFHDQLVRTPKGWRIRHRRLELHFVDILATITPGSHMTDLVAKP